MMPQERAGRDSLGCGTLEFFTVDLDHGHHRLHGFGGFGLVWVGDQVDEEFGIDLPGDTEVVGDPAAGDGLAAGCDEFGPVVIDLLLGVAEDGDGDSLGEGELRATVEGGEFAAIEREFDGHDAAGFEGGFWAQIGVAGDAGDF